jgi:hypothetical protein
MTKSDVVYFHSPINLRFLLLIIAKFLKKPVILQWIGSDVLIVTWKNASPIWDIGLEKRISVSESLLIGLPFFTRTFIIMIMKFVNTFIYILNKSVTHHVACTVRHLPVLEAVGIHAEYQPVLIHIKPKILPFPDDFSVLSYIGFHQSYNYRDFYGWNSLLRLANDYSDLKIYVLGHHTDLFNCPHNISFLGFLDDIRDILSKVKAVVRLTYHDGTPRMILEALATGRYVIYSQSFPCTIHVENYQELKNAIEKIREKDVANHEGFQYIQKNFGAEFVSRQFVRAFEITKQKYQNKF